MPAHGFVGYIDAFADFRGSEAVLGVGVLDELFQDFDDDLSMYQKR